MRYVFLAFMIFVSTGCESLKRLPGLDSPHTTPPDQAAIDPNDFTLEGVTATDHDDVFTPVKGRTLTVQVKRPGMTEYDTLKGNEAGILHQYRAFTAPREGVYFENIDGGWFKGEHPSAPKGTLYRIHNVKSEVKP